MTLTSRLLLARRLMKRIGERPRRGFTLIELLVVVVIIGILASVALPSFVGAQDKARNAPVAANINTVRMALEQYSTDNNGSYPTLSEMTTKILANNYLPGNKMPKAPWSTGNQSNFLTMGVGASITTIADGSATLSSVGTVISASGVVQPTAPSATNHYGFIAFDYAPDNQVYVLQGTGKKNKSAIIAGTTSNGSN
jgi:general secretion pathway protein G